MDCHEILKNLALHPDHVRTVSESFDKHRPLHHNEEHCQHVAMNAYKIGVEAKLEPIELKHVFLAALYHDAAHLQNENDDINVISSAAWYQAYAPRDTLLRRAYVNHLILSSSVRNKNWRNKLEAILHDADIAQIVCLPTYDEQTRWSVLLSEEMNISVTPESSRRFFEEKALTKEARRVFA